MRAIYYPVSFVFMLLAGLTVQAQLWQQKTALPGSNGRHHPVTFSIGNHGYVLTGTKEFSTASKDFFRYDATNDSWTQMSDFPGAARSFAIGDASGGYGFIGFGMTGNGTLLNDLWRYDTATESWTQMASCPCQGRRHPSLVINHNEGKLYVGNGDNLQFNLKDWWEFDIANNQWLQRTDFPGVARHHPFQFSMGDYVYSGLGHGPSIHNDLHRFDPATNSWQMMASAPGVRVAGTQFSYGGYGFVLSGDGPGHNPTNPAAFWGYNPAADGWFQLPPHPGTSRWAPGSFVIGDILYFTGGQDGQTQQLKGDLLAFDLKVALSEEKFDLPSVAVYPNPAGEYIQVDLERSNAPAQLRFVTLDGRLVYACDHEERVDVSHLPAGIYLLEVDQGEDHPLRTRLVIE